MVAAFRWHFPPKSSCLLTLQCVVLHMTEDVSTNAPSCYNAALVQWATTGTGWLGEHLTRVYATKFDATEPWCTWRPHGHVASCVSEGAYERKHYCQYSPSPAHLCHQIYFQATFLRHSKLAWLAYICIFLRITGSIWHELVPVVRRMRNSYIMRSWEMNYVTCS